MVDVDDDTGRRSLDELESKHGKLPPTISALTGRGEHLYFRLNGHSVRNSAGLLGPGLDVRGDGGYVLLPPSVHPSGRIYTGRSTTRRFRRRARTGFTISSTQSSGMELGETAISRRKSFGTTFFPSSPAKASATSALIKVAGQALSRGLRDPFVFVHALNFTTRAHLKPPLPARRNIARSFILRTTRRKVAEGERRHGRES